MPALPGYSTEVSSFELPVHSAIGPRRWASLVVAAFAVACTTGCQNLAAGMPASQVRIIDTSADAPDLDIYQGDAVLAYNLGFGTVSSYVSIAPGASTISTHAAGLKQPLSAVHGTFAASGHYTVLLTADPSGTVSEKVLLDQSVAAPFGMASIRVIGQARRSAGNVDVYVVRAGAALTESRPLMTNVAFGESSDYANVPTGSYRVVVVAAGATTPVYSGATVRFSSGSARTVVLLDSQRIDGPRMQVVTAEDFDPGVVVK